MAKKAKKLTEEEKLLKKTLKLVYDQKPKSIMFPNGRPKKYGVKNA